MAGCVRRLGSSIAINRFFNINALDVTKTAVNIDRWQCINKVAILTSSDQDLTSICRLWFFAYLSSAAGRWMPAMHIFLVWIVVEVRRPDSLLCDLLRQDYT